MHPKRRCRAPFQKVQNDVRDKTAFFKHGSMGSTVHKDELRTRDQPRHQPGVGGFHEISCPRKKKDRRLYRMQLFFVISGELQSREASCWQRKT